MDKFEEILDSPPEKPARSRLDPYGGLINELLDRGWTYREVARILAKKCNIQVAFSTIHHFVRVRLRPKRDPPKLQSPKLSKKTVPPTARAEEKEASSAEKESPAVDDAYQRIAALKQRPVSLQKTAMLFHYDPNEPLHLPEKPAAKKTGEQS